MLHLRPSSHFWRDLEGFWEVQVVKKSSQWHLMRLSGDRVLLGVRADPGGGIGDL